MNDTSLAVSRFSEQYGPRSTDEAEIVDTGLAVLRVK